MKCLYKKRLVIIYTVLSLEEENVYCLVGILNKMGVLCGYVLPVVV